MSKIDLTRNCMKQINYVGKLFLLTLYFFAILGPANSIYPSDGLDPSWKWVLNQAYQSNWQWGKDIVFTFGPWGIVYTNQFDPSLVLVTTQFVAWLTISLSLAVFILDRCNKSKFLLFAMLLFSMSMVSIDALLMAVCIFPALQNARGKDHTVSANILFIITLAMLGLGKSGFLIIALVTVFLVDFRSVSRKSTPVNLALFVLFITLLYIFSGQDITLFYSFIASSLDIISGYGTAMNLVGPNWQLSVFLVFTVVLAMFVAKRVNKAELDPRRNISILIIAFYLFLCFKSGFVRQDGHILIAFSGMVIAAFFIYTSYSYSFNSFWRFTYFTIVMMCFVIFTENTGGLIDLESRFRAVPSKLRCTSYMLLSPHSWYLDNVVKYNNAKVKVQKKYPVNLTGSVDILSSNQAALIANNLKYKPRPIFQEFVVYSPKLANINLEYFKKTPPDHFLFTIGSIDGRHPGLSDGYIWPLLYKCYTLEGYIPSINAYDMASNNSSVCRQKANNLNLIASEYSSLEVPIKVPAIGKSIIYAKLNFLPSIWGRLVNFFYKENPLFIEISYSNGDKEISRIIPKMASSGFFIDSQVGDMNKLANIFTGYTNRFPTQIIVKHNGFFGAGYSNIEAQFYEYSVKEIRLFDSYFGKRFIREAYLLNRLVESSPVKAPFVERSGPSRIDSHAPSNLSLDIDNKISVFEFEIGIREGASDKFDGVCFEVNAVTEVNQQKVLMTHCFSRQESATEQIYKVSVQLPENTNRLYFKNTCKTSCNYDWAFYQNFKMESDQ